MIVPVVVVVEDTAMDPEEVAAADPAVVAADEDLRLAAAVAVASAEVTVVDGTVEATGLEIVEVVPDLAKDCAECGGMTSI